MARAQIRTSYQIQEEEEPFEGSGGREMGGGFKAQVRLGDVRPNDRNPRRDFGDIDALARSIEATGGEPVNPMVLVRDGNVYRIVDGERRYRALRQIHGEDDRVDALVFADYGEASAVVAMVATDDKMRLSPAEQAMGFQTMMALGVDEEVTAKAVGRDVDQVRRARRSLAAVSKGEQGSLALDALILAGDDEFSDEERRQIVACGDFHQAKSKALDIRTAHKAAEQLASLRALMPDGIEFHDGPRPVVEDSGVRMAFVREVRSAKDATSLVKELADGAGHHAYHAPWGGRTWQVYRELAEGEDASSAEDAKAAREREERERKLDLMRRTRYSAMEFALDALRDGAMAGLPATCAKVMESRKLPEDGAIYDMDTFCVERPGDLQACEPTAWEVFMWVHDKFSMTSYWWSTPWSSDGGAKERVAAVWDALTLDGWVPPEGIAEVREACGKAKQ